MRAIGPELEALFDKYLEHAPRQPKEPPKGPKSPKDTPKGLEGGGGVGWGQTTWGVRWVHLY